MHRFVVDLYSQKFPELESLIPNKLDYVRTVQRIGNEMVRALPASPPPSLLDASQAAHSPIPPFLPPSLRT